jgi:UDP-N-acetylglucosamine--N-acetylmuramyl-(pentapeptide) pyrophosphoryl-undecaprenol N-acetylglucosamine transferase
MAGGTGGHVFPALAVAHRLQEKGWEIHWLGTKAGLEADIVTKAHIPLHYISVKGLRRKGGLAWVIAPYQLLIALFQSIRIILQLKPKVVLGMGGFVSGPGGLAAWLTHCPLVIHEQNSIVGMTNRWLARIAKRVLEAFPGAFKPSVKAICVGNPVRENLLALPGPVVRFQERNGPIKLLILGGSRGAQVLNQICPLALKILTTDKRPEVWHQTGAGQDAVTQELYQKMGVVAHVEPFIQDMANAYAWADLVLCRAGALTIAELTAVGIGSILVPFPFAVDDHQTVNARFLEKAGAAILIQQSVLNKERLAQIISELSLDRRQLLNMAEIAHSLAYRDALMAVTTYCEEAGQA